MRDYIVKVSAPGYPGQWITVRAASQSDARTQVQRHGWIYSGVYYDFQTAKEAYPNDSRLVGEIYGESPELGSLSQLPKIGVNDDLVDDPTSPQADPERYEFGPSFLRALRQRGINVGPGGGLLGSQIREAQEPLFSRFYGSTVLTPGSEVDPKQDEISFANFIANQQGQNLLGRGGAQQARDLLNKAMGFKRFGQDELPSLLAGGFLNPATSTQGEQLANIAREAGRQRFGSLARYLPSAFELSQDYLSQDRPQKTTFADFLNRRIFG